ncbi:uncharacterized protein LOC143887102 isoform X2 [Tasmannia lanceolata]|uniref:uncharacterized protein LOC143887102 isoform X2 n=1 Tax=Tasmannia lanceolata TaxID=3420 RepID=UPI0040629B60
MEFDHYDEEFCHFNPNETYEFEFDEFYENFSAPMFVDLQNPDRSVEDDKEWFCTRLGCNQKHDEEDDPDILHRKFELRVMAARSLRLQNSLKGQTSRCTARCRPLPAPAKFAKERIAILNMIRKTKKASNDPPRDVGFCRLKHEIEYEEIKNGMGKVMKS